MSIGTGQNSLSCLIRERRILAGLTITELAQQCGISTSHLSRIEQGNSFPSASVLSRLANSLDIDEYEMLSQAALIILSEPGVPHRTEMRLINSLKQALPKHD